MSDPTRSDIDFKNKMAWVWTTLKPRVTEFFRDTHFPEQLKHSYHSIQLSFLLNFFRQFDHFGLFLSEYQMLYQV